MNKDSKLIAESYFKRVRLLNEFTGVEESAALVYLLYAFVAAAGTYIISQTPQVKDSITSTLNSLKTVADKLSNLSVEMLKSLSIESIFSPLYSLLKTLVREGTDKEGFDTITKIISLLGSSVVNEESLNELVNNVQRLSLLVDQKIIAAKERYKNQTNIIILLEKIEKALEGLKVDIKFTDDRTSSKGGGGKGGGGGGGDKFPKLPEGPGWGPMIARFLAQAAMAVQGFNMLLRQLLSFGWMGISFIFLITGLLFAYLILQAEAFFYKDATEHRTESGAPNVGRAVVRTIKPVVTAGKEAVVGEPSPSPTPGRKGGGPLEAN